MAFLRNASCLHRLLLIAILSCLPGAALAQDVAKVPFLAEHYDISASLDPAGQSLSAVAKVDFRATEVSSILRVELHPNLNVSEIKSSAGKALNFERDNLNPLLLNVNLPSAVSANSTVTLTFTYTGPLANEENSPVPNVRLASIYKDGAYLLLPSRWFPLTAYPTNRYTGTFRLTVPDTFSVAGTGKALSPSPVAARSAAEGGRLLYVFECPQAEPNGSFVAGPLKLTPKQSEGLSVSVFAPPSAPTNAGDVVYGDPDSRRRLARICRTRADCSFTTRLGSENQRPRDRAAGGFAVVGQSSSSCDARRRVDQRRIVSLLRSALCRTKLRQRSRPARGGRFCCRRFDERGSRADLASRALGSLHQRLSLGGNEQGRYAVPHVAGGDGRRTLQIPAAQFLHNV